MKRKSAPTMDFKKMANSKKVFDLGGVLNFFKLGTKQNNGYGSFNSGVYSKSNTKRNNDWSKKTSARSAQEKESNELLQKFLFGVLKILVLPLIPFFVLGRYIFVKISPYFSKATLIKIAYIGVFGAIIFNFAKLQVLGSTGKGTVTAKDLNLSVSQLILARRGQIYAQDLSQSEGSDRRYIPLTSTQNVADLYFNPFQLKGLLQQGVKLDEVVSWISGSLNLSYGDVYQLLKTETDKTEPRKYVLIQQFINENQKSVVEYLRSNPDTKVLMQQIGLNIQEKEIRSYPQGPLLSQAIGYVPKYQVDKAEALKIGGCRDMVNQNEQRGTSPLGYTVGYYGMEQKFCSLLAGVNGRQIYNNEINSTGNNTKVENGADIYTTIDKNIQLRTEQVLDKAIKDNTNSNGSPKNATALVMEAKTGRILSMASSPTYDPSRYSDFSNNPEVYRNQASGGDYEVGSVMKPITFAAALNVFQVGKTGSKGQKLGVAPDFTFEDYDEKGKPYRALNGETIYIRNSKGASYKNQGRIGLDTCILYSINTCISEVVDTVGNVEMKYNFEELFGFGRPTAVSLPGDSSGQRNVTTFSQDINCPSCYARYGFGQGFFISPVQLLRAFTAIANRGVLTEPYLVEKVKYADGTEDYGADSQSPIKRELPKQIIKESVARQVTDYMVGLLENTQPGVGASKARVPGYSIACKTGTAEKITNENGKVYSYADNRNRGIYIHTMVCFNNNKDNPLLFLVKIDEPKPGQVDNFSGDTIGPQISDLMKSTFEYLGIPKDK